MIDNLEDAIAHAKEKAEELKDRAYTDFDSWTDEGKAKANDCLECARDHERLALWLEELAKRREADRWIPVSERLPEPLTEVLVTSTNGYVYTSRIVHGEFEYGGNIIAWKPLPEPYKENEK